MGKKTQKIAKNDYIKLTIPCINEKNESYQGVGKVF